MQSKAASVDAYLAELTPDRRAAIGTLRDVIRANLDKGFVETMSYGMIGYCVPHSIYPNGYHCDPKQPLPFACLASQKNHISLYVMGVYLDCTDERPSPLLTWFKSAWAKTGKKLDMGKSCIRFKKIEDVPLEVVGELFRRQPMKAYIALYESLLGPNGKPVSAGKPAAKTAASAAAKKKVVAKPSRAGSKATSKARTGSGARAATKSVARRSS